MLHLLLASEMEVDLYYKMSCISLTGCCNHEELNRLLTSTVMIRRLKKEVLDQLPPKRRQQVHFCPDEGCLTAFQHSGSATFLIADVSVFLAS